MRISNAARSSDWIKTEFNNQSAPTTFVSVGSQQGSGGGGSVVAAPVFSVPGGTYSTAQSVTLSTATSGASIRYTTDGSNPSETAGTLYNNTAIAINSTTTLKAIAYLTGMTDSAISSATYTLMASAPAFSVPGGTYSTAQSVTLSTATSGASIRYTTDGSNPSETARTLYNNTAIAINSTTTLKAIAYLTGMTDSAISSATYTIGGSGPGWYNNGWSNRKAVTINHTDVSGAASLTNFPMLFSVTDANLRTVANGGGVGNADGSDILFTAADGVTKLNHELESYNGTTGQVIAWVQIPALSPTTDTVVYLYYGNAGAANQANAGGVWDSNFKGVWHFANGTTLSVADSTANGNNGTNNGIVATAGQVDGGASLNGSSNYMAIPAASYPGYPNSGSTSTYVQTTEVWFKTGSGGVILGQDDGTRVGAGPGGWVSALYIDTGGKLRASLFYHGTAGAQIVTPASYNDNNWHHLVDVYNTGTESLYVDGVLAGSQTAGEVGYSGVYSYSLGVGESIGWTNGNSGWFYWNGALDELRISNAARSSDWIKTEFNNQSAPTEFIAVGPNQSVP